MANIAVAPRILRKYTLTVGADNYEAATEQVLFQPTAQTQTWTGGDGESHSDSSASTWTCTIGHVQDWNTPNSLGQYLLEHEGEQVEVTFQPTAGVGPTFTSTVTIVPSAIGGTNGAWPTTTAAMPCSKPELVPAPAGFAAPAAATVDDE